MKPGKLFPCLPLHFCLLPIFLYKYIYLDIFYLSVCVLLAVSFCTNCSNFFFFLNVLEHKVKLSSFTFQVNKATSKPFLQGTLNISLMFTSTCFMHQPYKLNGSS